MLLMCNILHCYIVFADSNKDTNTQKNNNISSYKLNAVVSVGKTSNIQAYQSGSVINRKILDSNPSGNGDITSLLRILPNVQFDNAQLKSTTPGEISPANISISGGLFYQNNFQLDGFNMNNDLDPAGTQNTQKPELNQQGVPGRSQGFNIDTSLLDSIIVQDSNISAAYGGFSGGVIQANTRRANKKFGAKISYQITQGDATPNKFSLTNYHVYGDINEFLNSSYSNNQPKFIKHIFRSSVESKINQNMGIIASFTTTQSFIPLKGYALDEDSIIRDDIEKTQTRQNYNFFIKGHYDIGENVRLEASYSYMPEFSKYYVVNAKDSDFFYQSGGHNLGVKALFDNELGSLNAQTNFSYLEDSRTKSATDYKTWLYSTEKNWSNNKLGTEEGGYGNVDNKEISIDFKVAQEFEPIYYSIWENRISSGIELGFSHVYYKRHQDTRIALNTILIAMEKDKTCTDTNWCTNTAPEDTTQTDIQGKPLTNGYYFGFLNYLHAGEIALNNFNTGIFVEDDMNFDLKKYGNLNIRFGLRLDYEIYMNKAPIAPRLALNYKAPWGDYSEYSTQQTQDSKKGLQQYLDIWKNNKNFTTQFTFGYNRYYGRNIFAFRLMDGRAKLDKQYWKVKPDDLSGPIPEETPYEQSPYVIDNGGVETNFTRLKVPYDDELMFGISQQIALLELNTKYIHRFGRDQVMTKCNNFDNKNDCKGYIYSNDGMSDSDIVTISLSNNKPIEFFGVSNYILFAFDWTHLQRNFNNYANIFANPQLANQIISYNGQFIRYMDRPAENFFRPYTIRLTTTHAFNLWKTKCIWNNFFRIRSKYDSMVAVGKDLQDSYNGVKVETFRVFNVPLSFTWDMRFSFEIDVAKQNNLFVNLDIYNVLDSKNIAILDLSAFSSSTSATAIPTYEIGRQFWIELGYKF